MENVYRFTEEYKARRFCWELMKLPEDKVKVDKVLVVGEKRPYRFEITVRYWSDETERLVDQINSECFEDEDFEFEADEKVDEQDEVETIKEIAKRDALLMAACSMGMGLKVRLIDDLDGCDDVDDLVHLVALAMTSTPPGPSVKTLNFVLDNINKKEGIEYYA